MTRGDDGRIDAAADGGPSLAPPLLTSADMTAAHRASHQFPTVRLYMTPTPHTVGRRQSLTAARRIMREHGIRHLPVLDGGQLVGVLSERDVLLVESLPGTNPTNVYAEEAMVSDVFTTTADAPMADVVEEMVARKMGSALVTDAGRVVGVLTTIDALRALLDLLSAGSEGDENENDDQPPTVTTPTTGG